MRSHDFVLFPNDFASMVMTMACADELLDREGAASSYAYEARYYGVRKRAYSTPTTLGSMGRNRNGESIVSPARLVEWIRRQPAVATIYHSELWDQLRLPRVLHRDTLKSLDPACRSIYGERSIFRIPDWQESIHSVIWKLSACGTFDAIALLISMLVEARNVSEKAIEFACARHIPAALAMTGATPAGRRVALLIFARLRLLLLDRCVMDGYRLDLSTFDMMAKQEAAKELPPLQMETTWETTYDGLRQRRSDYAVERLREMPEERLRWVETALPGCRHALHPGGRSVWANRMGPAKNPLGPCAGSNGPALHPRARERMRQALGIYM